MTTVPAAKGALLDLLQARAELQGVQVAWAHPGANLIEPECIYLGDVDEGEAARVMGNRRRDESYGIDVIVTVEQYGNDARATEERCWQLVAPVEQAVRENPDLALPGVIDTAQVSGKRLRNYPDTEARIAECVVRVAVTARI